MSDRLWGETLEDLEAALNADLSYRPGYVEVRSDDLARLLQIARSARDTCDAYFHPERFGDDCDFNEDMKSLREECQDYEER